MSLGARLGTLLAQSGRPWPAPIEHHASLGSTNDRLKELARQGAPEWSVVQADLQTAGHGRHGRAWASPAGNLHLSVLLRPATAAVSLLSLVAGLGAAEGIESFGVTVALKWPNDLIASGRKLGGLLAESSSTGESLDWLVLGLGVNVSAELPAELRETAISLVEAGARPASTEEVAAAVLGRLTVWYHRWAQGARAEVVGAWRERSLPWWGERVEAWSAGRRVTGRALDLDDDGGLILETEEGSRLTLVSGEVALCRVAAAPRPSF